MGDEFIEEPPKDVMSLVPKSEDLWRVYKKYYSDKIPEFREDPDEAAKEYIDSMMDNKIVTDAIEYVGKELENRARRGVSEVKIVVESFPQFYMMNKDYQDAFDKALKKWRMYNFKKYPVNKTSSEVKERSLEILKLVVFYFVNYTEGYDAYIEDSYPRRTYAYFGLTRDFGND